MPGLNLTRVEAEERASVITAVHHYNIELDLSGNETDFRSRTTITFDAVAGSSTFADLVSHNVLSIELNGENIPTSQHVDNRIQLDNLAEHNTLVVDALCQYMHTGEGLHRFVDPADGQAYTYSQFEVPDARRVYTTFEQPDLKSTFTFTVTVPAGWMVFSNAPTQEPEKTDTTWIYRFAETERMSTYITAIVAGPYQGVTDSLTSSDGRTINLGVYARASLAEHLDHERIIDITKKGFNFFEAQYGIAYPFTKYDQVFVPEYNAGAMENAGIVTFRDQYIFRTRPTEAQLETRANTILHELAHMWFGDLVTMKWWNDLWLNESFAEFMSHLALAEGTEYVDAWVGFGLRKDWGMRQDQLPTTHPIKAEIRDLADVEVNFDGITYAKGAAVLRQLVSYVGREPFQRAIHEYLTTHSYANATLADLLSELEKASGRDLTAWSQVWLEEAGITILRPVIDTNEDGSIARLAVAQEIFTEGASLRPHRMAIAGYSFTDGAIQRVFHTELDVDGNLTEVTDAQGIARPDMILLNEGDLAYAKVRLDDESLAFATAHIAHFTDPLARSVIMSTAWDMTRDGEMSARAYLDLALAALPAEDNSMMMQLAIRRLDEAVRTFVAPAHRARIQAEVAERLLLQARVATSGSDQQTMLVRAAAAHAYTDEQFQAISRLYNGEDTLVGLDLDIDLKWDLLISMVRGGLADETTIEAMSSEDDTMTGRQNAAAALAARADSYVKAETWEAIVRDQSIPNDTRWAMVAGFWAQARVLPELYVPFVDDYFNSLEQIWAENTFHTAEDLVTLMFPAAIAGYATNLDLVARGQQWIAQHPDVSAALIRLLSERVAVAERMLKAQQADA